MAIRVQKEGPRNSIDSSDVRNRTEKAQHSQLQEALEGGAATKKAQYLSKSPLTERIQRVAKAFRQEAERRQPHKIANRADLIPQLRLPDGKSIKAFVYLVDDYVADLNVAASLENELALLVRPSVLHGAFPALVSFRAGEPKDTALLIIDIWEAHALMLSTAALPSTGQEDEADFLALYSVAACDLLIKRMREAHAAILLRRLAVHLELSQDELGRIFHVTGETVRRWEKIKSKISAEHMAELESAGAALTHLLELFHPGRLSEVVRRRADLFEGERALDWILRGRLADVADRYEAALAYQG